MSERIEKAAEELERLKAECQEWLRVGEKIPIPEEHREVVALVDFVTLLARRGEQLQRVSQSAAREWEEVLFGQD